MESRKLSFVLINQSRTSYSHSQSGCILASVPVSAIPLPPSHLGYKGPRVSASLQQHVVRGAVTVDGAVVVHVLEACCYAKGNLNIQNIEKGKIQSCTRGASGLHEGIGLALGVLFPSAQFSLQSC